MFVRLPTDDYLLYFISEITAALHHAEIPIVPGPSQIQPADIPKTDGKKYLHTVLLLYKKFLHSLLIVLILLFTDNANIGTNISTKSNRRVIHTTNKWTPHCARLRKIYRKSQKQSNYYQRTRRALIFSKTKSFEKLTDKMNPLAKKFIWMQIEQCTKKARGRRFSDEEKLIALSIMKQSPKCYRFLHKIFILPSKYTLNKMIASLNVEAGINTQIFEAIKEEVPTYLFLMISYMYLLMIDLVLKELKYYNLLSGQHMG